MGGRSGVIKKILLILVIWGILSVGSGEKQIKAEDALWENQGEWGTDTGNDSEEDNGEWNNESEYYEESDSLLEDNEKGYWQQGGFSDSPDESHGNGNNENQTVNKAYGSYETGSEYGNKSNTPENSQNIQTEDSADILTSVTSMPENNTIQVTATPSVYAEQKNASEVTPEPKVTVTSKETVTPKATVIPKETVTPVAPVTATVTMMPETLPEENKTLSPKLYFWSAKIEKGSQAEILMNPGTESELISARINGQEQSWKRYGNKVILKLDQHKQSCIELTFLGIEELSWTERKNNVILCYNIL